MAFGPAAGGSERVLKAIREAGEKQQNPTFDVDAIVEAAEATLSFD